MEPVDEVKTQEKAVEAVPIMNQVLDAVKELTKGLADNTKEIGILREEQEELSKQIELSRKAGKF